MIRLLSCAVVLSTVAVAQFFSLDACAAIDQQYVPEMSSGTARIGGYQQSVPAALGQTFGVGITGLFTGFDVWVTRAQSTTLPMFYDIRRTVSGLPTVPDSGTDILAAGTITASQFDVDGAQVTTPPSNLTHIELSNQSFPVVAGEVLAIVLRTDASSGTNYPYGWYVNTRGDYANGASYYRPASVWHLNSFVEIGQTVDQVFRTYVDPAPEPSTFALLGIGAISLLGYRKAKSHG